MACYQVQCIQAPCEPICTPDPIPTGIVTGPYVNQTLPYRNIDPRLLMSGPQSLTRQAQTYQGQYYPSGYLEPDFKTTTESLDYWRLVLLALGIIVGAVVIKRL